MTDAIIDRITDPITGYRVRVMARRLGKAVGGTLGMPFEGPVQHARGLPVWVGGVYAFGREDGRRSPSLHRVPPVQAANPALDAGDARTD